LTETTLDARVAAFKQAIQQVCDEHGFGFYLEPSDGYDAENDAYLCVSQLLPGAECIGELPWFDLAAQIAEEARLEAERQKRWAEQEAQNAERRAANAIIFPEMRTLFQRTGLTLWTDRLWGVQTVPFSEGRWQALSGAQLKTGIVRLSHGEPALAEQIITDAHRAALPEFWGALEELFRRTGYIPSFDEAPRAKFYAVNVIPIYSDALPDWLDGDKK
jgi:hypothetical protein